MSKLKPRLDIQPVTEVRANESMMDELTLLRDVRTAEEQVADGRKMAHALAAKRLRAHLAK